MVFTPVPLRECISRDDSETVIFACDALSQPCYRRLFREVDPLVHTKTARALPIAREHDVVVLSGRLDPDYYAWLRGLGLGSRHVAAYGRPKADVPLSALILADPAPVQRAVACGGRRPVFVPFYSGEEETRVAELLGAELFGCREDISLKYFNKESFKQACLKLNIAMVDGSSCDVPGLRVCDLEEIVLKLLQSYPSVLIRGSLGAAGSSAYQVSSADVGDVLENIRKSRDKKMLIEPFLQVIASPNDQWAIDRQGCIHYLGISAQLFSGLRHVGNLQGQYFSERIAEYIRRTSLKIVHDMAVHGYRGVLGIDYIVTSHGIYPIENNARLNGSSFTLAIVDRLAERHGRIPCWKFFKASVEPCSFTVLARRLAPLLYDGSSSNSVFLYDCDALPVNGTFTCVLLAEDMYHIDHLTRALEELGVAPPQGAPPNATSSGSS